MDRKVGIVVAVNGGMQRDREGAKVPITPAEIAEDALLCFNEGAAVVHVHARDAQGNNSGDVAIYQDIIRRIRARLRHPRPDNERHRCSPRSPDRGVPVAVG